MLTLLQGDDTAANNKTIRLKMPDVEIGDGFTIGFVFQGIDKSGAYVPGGTLSFDYTRQQTSAFPLGVSYGRTYLMKDNLMQTISNTIPVMITDSVARANGVNNDVNLSVVVNTGVPHVDKNPVSPSSTISELKSLANALLAAINASGPTGES